MRQGNEGLPRGVWNARLNVPEFIVLHHTDNQRKAGHHAASVESTHKNRGYPLSITGHQTGYHYVIERDGYIEKRREEWEEGAHAPEEQMNFRSIGIALAGDFTTMHPTALQIYALKDLIAEIRTRHDIPDERILLHGEISQTTCPSLDLRKLLD